MDTVDLTFATGNDVTIEPVLFDDEPGVRVSVDEVEVAFVLENFELEDIVKFYGKDKLLNEINKPEED